MKKRKQVVYVFHFCKNSLNDDIECKNGWMDVDLTNPKTYPPKWKYCAECCEKYGLVNPETPPKRKLSKKQKEVLKKNQFKKREKPPILSLNDMDDTKGAK